VEKGFEGKIEPNCPVLQDLRMERGRRKAVSFKGLHGNRLSGGVAVRFEVNGLDVPLLDVPGSFSFIDADHFINLMQAVATNAAGYAFKLALSTMCPTCDGAIMSLQRAMQKLNAMAGDSCRLAQTGVDYMADKLGTAELAKQMEAGPLASVATAVGSKADAFSSFLDGVNRGSNTKSLGDNEIKALLGNAAWKILQRNSFVSSAFLSGDNELAEALMSVTGTIVGVKGTATCPLSMNSRRCCRSRTF